MQFLGISLLNDDEVSIITEICEQGSLKSIIERYKGKLPIKRKLMIAFDIIKGIHYMHTLSPSIIHRDLKPENILITSDLKAKLGDFGYFWFNCNRISKAFESTENCYSTETMSTINYMAPETLSKSKYSAASDIYSFGICLYELLQEKPAFDGIEGFDLIDGIVNHQLRPEIPEQGAIWSLMKSCWNHNESERPSSSDVCKQLIILLKENK